MVENFNILEYDVVESTMDIASELLQQGLPKKNRIKVVLAKTQLAGRGRQGHDWISLSGNLHKSLILKLSTYDIRNIYQLSFVMSVALHRVIDKLIGKGISRNKWPNDLLIEGKKIAGVLLEAHPSYNAVIIGVGVNMLKKPDHVMYPATSLHSHGIYLSPKSLATQITLQFEQLLYDWESGNFDSVLKEWKKNVWGIGKEASVLHKQEVLRGIVYDIDDNGFLLLKEASGHIHRIFAGDIIIEEKESK